MGFFKQLFSTSLDEQNPTEVTHINQELYKKSAELNEQNHLKDELISLASHELRTPLASVKNYIWMVMGGKEHNLTQQQQLYLQRAYISTERLISLVNDMLNVSRIDSGRITLETQPFDMQKLTQAVIDEIRPHADEFHVTLMVTPSPSLPAVQADSEKIREVLINLIGNAIKFTPSNGTVTISFVQNGNMVETTVSDNGTGIEPADVPKLFQKFGMVRESYIPNRSLQGTGLGLYICKAIVQMHQGKIWLHSEGRGKGSQFTFSLPIATATKEA